MSIDALISYGRAVLSNSLGVVLNHGHFLSLLPMLVALLIGLGWLLWRLRRSGHPPSLRLLRRVLLPRRVFLHRSALHDYAVFLINQGLLFSAIGAALVTPSLFAAGTLVVGKTIGLQVELAPASLAERIAVSVFLVLVWDFAATYAHYLKHRLPLLWEFHKIHHCAEVLNPVTALRRHPIEAAVSSLITAAILGLAMGLWLLVFGRFDGYSVFGSWAGIYAWRLLGYNLRHSHLPLSYGPFWNRILISPLQHQIHHSNDPRHYDCNFGHIFAVWDRLFGTLYVPAAGERVQFGLDAVEADDYRTLKGLYFTPFRKAGALLLRRPRLDPQASA
jgi:sterol desaturase/sphingolipid hydroxylase (fatty acid hydroxylase superfamily)